MSLSVSVQTAFRLGLPDGTEIVAGRTGMSQDVGWPAVPRTRAPAFGSVGADDIVLLSTDALRLIDETLTLDQVIDSLAEHNVSALVVLGNINKGAVETADRVGLPLMRLPAGVSIANVEQTLARAISERRSELYRHSLELHRELVEISLAGRGLESILSRLCEITRRNVALLDEQLGVKSYHSANQHPDLSALQRIISSSDLTLYWPDSDIPGTGDPPTTELNIDGYQVLLAPVRVRNIVLGHLAFVSSINNMDEADSLALSRASVVCALEMAKQSAVDEAEHRLRGDFFSELLDGTSPPEVLLARANGLGYELGQPSRCLVAGFDDDRVEPRHTGARATSGLKELSRQVSRILNSRRIAAPLTIHKDALLVICPANHATSADDVNGLAHRIANVPTHDKRSISIGIGRIRQNIEGIRISYREANQALVIGRRIFGHRHVSDFADLGVYRLLYALAEGSELQTYCEETLSELQRYDDRNGTELIQTLVAFFECHGNLRATAESLFLHRNSLSYRLKRIQEIAGIDLDNFEDRFRIQLSLKARQVVHS